MAGIGITADALFGSGFFRLGFFAVVAALAMAPPGILWFAREAYSLAAARVKTPESQR
jgi:hypothetical protein